MDAVRGIGSKASGAVLGVAATMWTDAAPEQQRLTVQLARNSFYFTAACILIRFFGDQLSL